MDNEKKLSRRTILRGAVVAAGAGTVLLSGMSAAWAEKFKQDAPNVAYSKTPDAKGNHCSVCANYVDPKQCKIVDGEIDPNGSCKLFVKKPA
jgi:hypothetical protein